LKSKPINFIIPKLLVVYCGYLSDDGNAEWNETLSNGTIANGKCLDGFQGSVSRKCLQSGNWGSISGTCNGILFLKKNSSFDSTFLFKI